MWFNTIGALVVGTIVLLIILIIIALAICSVMIVYGVFKLIDDIIHF